jgi:hypothetical protein
MVRRNGFGYCLILAKKRTAFSGLSSPEFAGTFAAPFFLTQTCPH